MIAAIGDRRAGAEDRGGARVAERRRSRPGGIDATDDDEDVGDGRARRARGASAGTSVR